MMMTRIEMLIMAVVLTAMSAMSQNLSGQKEKQDSITAEWGDTLQLQDVEVVTMRQLVKTLDDRLSYNVQADLEARTSTVLDMLRKVPLVSVDGEDNVRVKTEERIRLGVHFPGRKHRCHKRCKPVRHRQDKNHR